MKDLKITKGVASLKYVSGCCIGVGVSFDFEGGTYSEMICNSLLPDTDDEYEKQKEVIEADMKLIAEAFNVANETNKTPSELWIEVQGLRRLSNSRLKDIMELEAQNKELVAANEKLTNQKNSLADTVRKLQQEINKRSCT